MGETTKEFNVMRSGQMLSWVLGILSTIALGFSSYLALQVQDLGQKVAVLEAEREPLARAVEKLNVKVEALTLAIAKLEASRFVVDGRDRDRRR